MIIASNGSLLNKPHLQSHPQLGSKCLFQIFHDHRLELKGWQAAMNAGKPAPGSVRNPTWNGQSSIPKSREAEINFVTNKQG